MVSHLGTLLHLSTLTLWSYFSYDSELVTLAKSRPVSLYTGCPVFLLSKWSIQRVHIKCRFHYLHQNAASFATKIFSHAFVLMIHCLYIHCCYFAAPLSLFVDTML